MTEDQQKKRLKEPFRLVLMKEETLEEVGSYRLSLLNVYMLVSSVVVIVALLVIAIVFFTPVKRLVPGYADIGENREYMELYQKVATLQSQVEAQEMYNETFRNLITGGSDSLTTEVDDGHDHSAESMVQASNDRPEIQITELPAKATALDRGPSSRNWSNAREIDFLYIVAPVKGPVSAVFDAEINHYGVDVLAPKNTPVKAALDGYIITSDWTLETGNTLGIQHANDMVTFYKHNARNLKSLGSFVKAGEAVAIVGNTGEQSSGPHLHFELWVDGKPVDPQDFIDF